MAKTMCFILGFAFLALGILGITGLVPMFTTTLGWILLGVAVVMLVIGGVWLRSTVTIKF